jgi:hypothetical protein
MNKLLISLIIIVVLLVLGIWQYNGKLNMNNKPDYKTNALQTRQEVIDIAQQELFKHYPDGIRMDNKYELVDVTPFTGSSNWMIVYDIPNSFDTRVEIVIDPVLKKVISYKDLWS